MGNVNEKNQELEASPLIILAIMQGVYFDIAKQMSVCGCVRIYIGAIQHWISLTGCRYCFL